MRRSPAETPFTGRTPSAKGHLGFEIASNGLVASRCNVFLIGRCTDLPGGELRLVLIAETPAE